MTKINTKTSTLNSKPKTEEKVQTELSNVEKLKYFITMYNIEGDNGSSSKKTSSPSVWKSNGKSLSMTNLYGNTKVSVTSNTKFPKGEFGIQETGRLNKMLSCISDDVVTTKTGNQLKFKNGKVHFNYYLCGIESIEDQTKDIDVGDIDYNASISMTKDMMDDFSNCYSSFPSDVDGDTYVTINNKQGNYFLDVNQTNSHKMTIPVNVENDELKGKVSFSANSFNKVFKANPKSSGVIIDISDEGICLMTFIYNDKYSSFKSNYNVLPLSLIVEDDVTEELVDTSVPKLELETIETEVSPKDIIGFRTKSEVLETEMVEELV
tara:strand:- start:1021 stop:1986 length:966 start_codon:yes stop_codon:yes gene_type:complete